MRLVDVCLTRCFRETAQAAVSRCELAIKKFRKLKTTCVEVIVSGQQYLSCTLMLGESAERCLNRNPLSCDVYLRLAFSQHRRSNENIGGHCRHVR